MTSGCWDHLLASAYMDADFVSSYPHIRQRELRKVSHSLRETTDMTDELQVSGALG